MGAQIALLQQESTDYRPDTILLITRFWPEVTPDLIASRRFALDDFFILRWFMFDAPWRILPLPVDSNLLAAVLQVLSFGTYPTSL
jgi:hypothetical protein